ncbi:LacI family DNA-binding transcriptional regulator [Vallicoccus soli]|uniref:LacI family DNA-binding transcriptional regulator n=1 Tax=Vallicoccus soli TaxID=2339232 RepID=A0A3A3Z276_9ACTN|nr:LacI family DNA-binding transcriptional regulator [Vallicoccus soli]
MGDVARLAGVSHQTVSRVLNDPQTVRAATRARVEQAIAALGYRRNPAARSLVTRRSETLGVVSFDTTHYGPASTLWGIERSARDAGYFVSVATLSALSPRAVRSAVDRLLAQQVEGLVVVAPQDEVCQAVATLPRDLPLVVVETDDVQGVSRVSVDQARGARLAVEHLLGLGHRTVHHVAGPADWLEARARTAAWERALRDRGRPVPRVLQGDWSPASAYRAVLDLDLADVTALFVGNDQMALGALRALHERGVPVPERVSVVGFDDVPEAAYYSPPLTTVRQDFQEVGRRCIGLLLERVREGAGPATSVVRPELVVRASAGPPP